MTAGSVHAVLGLISLTEPTCGEVDTPGPCEPGPILLECTHTFMKVGEPSMEDRHPHGQIPSRSIGVPLGNRTGRLVVRAVTKSTESVTGVMWVVATTWGFADFYHPDLAGHSERRPFPTGARPARLTGFDPAIFALTGR